jgi:hypothetical protein
MSTVQTLIESANPWQSQQGDAARLAKKWDKSGLLEGLADYNKSNMAVMLENQAKQLVVEQSQTGTGGTFTPGTGEQWAGVALPLVRKVFGQIASKEFVSVQPMSLPAGLVFYLDFQYGSTKNPFAAGDSLYGTADSVEGFGNLAAGGLYGSGRFGYSLNQFSASLNFATSSGGSAPYFYSGSVDAVWALCGFDSNISASVAAQQVKIALIPTSSLSNMDPNGVRGFYFISASAGTDVITAADNLNQFNQVSGANVLLFFSASTAEVTTATTQTGSVFFNKKTADNARGDFEDGSSYAYPNSLSSSVIAIPEINVQLRSETIAAKTRKLKAQWTPEFAQDLNAYQNLDAEAELTSMLSEYISLEIDLEILDMLIQNAPIVEYWSAKVGDQINATNSGFNSNTSGVYYTQMTWFQTLGIKLQKVSNTIHQRTLRGGANFMVVSPAVATILESIPGFAADTDGAADNMKYAFGVQKVGQLNSRYKVYKNPYMLENVILMGFRGSQFLETGAVYAPYVPLIMTPLVYDPNTFTPRKGIMTRYAKKMVRPEFYGKVFVANLNIV